MPAGGLAFTWCQVPVLYVIDDDAEPKLVIRLDDGTEKELTQTKLPTEESSELFRRSGRILQLSLTFKTTNLFTDS